MITVVIVAAIVADIVIGYAIGSAKPTISATTSQTYTQTTRETVTSLTTASSNATVIEATINQTFQVDYMKITVVKVDEGDYVLSALTAPSVTIKCHFIPGFGGNKLVSVKLRVENLSNVDSDIGCTQ
jgi:hypothetical protein